jgi:hypothetical protein
MNARTSTAFFPALPAGIDGEQRAALLRFAAIVRALATLGRNRPPQAIQVPAASELPDLPTRRVNRLQRMLGRLRRRQEPSGKARRFRR